MIKDNAIKLYTLQRTTMMKLIFRYKNLDYNGNRCGQNKRISEYFDDIYSILHSNQFFLFLKQLIVTSSTEMSYFYQHK